MKKATLLLLILCKMCFPLFDTTVCIPSILINDSESVHLCLRITGKDKADSIHICYFIKEIGERLAIFDYGYPSIDDCSFWKKGGYVKDCNNEIECRLKYLIQDGFIKIHSELRENSLVLPDYFVKTLKEQLIKYLIDKAKLNNISATKRAIKLLEDIKKNKTSLINIYLHPEHPIGPFIWIKETNSFFEYVD
jgi:hypothetical protein